MATDKNKGGRPTKYKPEYAEQARKYCLLGATDAELAESFDVAEATINNWKLAHPKFTAGDSSDARACTNRGGQGLVMAGRRTTPSPRR